MLRRRAVVVAVEVNEASAVVAGEPSRFRREQGHPAEEGVEAAGGGGEGEAQAEASEAGSRTFRRALERRTRLTARVTVTAKDAAGNTRSAKRKIALKA